MRFTQPFLCSPAPTGQPAKIVLTPELDEMLRRIQDTKNVAGIMLINKEGLAVKSSLDSSVTAQVRFTITMYCFYYVPLLLLMVFFPPRAPYLFILQHWLSKHAKLIILSLQQKTSWKYVSNRQFVKQSIFPAFSIVRYKRAKRAKRKVLTDFLWQFLTAFFKCPVIWCFVPSNQQLTFHADRQVQKVDNWTIFSIKSQ